MFEYEESSSDCQTFEELEIEPGPDMITQFHDAHGRYPVLEVKKPSKLPTRYTAPGGDKRFHMKTTYRPGEAFHFVKTEPGKRSPEAVNIVLKHPTDSDSEIVVTPKDLAKKMWVNMDTPASVEADMLADPLASMPEKPTYGEDVKKILEKRKREAQVSI